MRTWVLLSAALVVLTGTFQAQPTGYVTLRWATPAPIAAPTITGVKVFKLHLGQPVYIGTVQAPHTSVTINMLPLGERHTFLLKTVDSVKGEGGFSEPVSSFAYPASGTIPRPAMNVVVK